MRWDKWTNHYSSLTCPYGSIKDRSLRTGEHVLLVLPIGEDVGAPEELGAVGGVGEVAGPLAGELGHGGVEEDAEEGGGEAESSHGHVSLLWRPKTDWGPPPGPWAHISRSWKFLRQKVKREAPDRTLCPARCQIGPLYREIHRSACIRINSKSVSRFLEGL